MKSFRFVFAGAMLSASVFAFAQPAAPAKASAAAAPSAPVAAPAKAAESMAPAPGTITWHATKAGGEHTGTFKNWKFTNVTIPGGDLTKGTLEFEVDVTSLTVEPEKLQNHLKSPDFFDATQFPKATVKISNVRPAADKDGMKSYDADATVSIRGVGQTFKANFVVESAKPLKVKGTSTLDHLLYKMAYDEKNPGKINAPVDITIEATVPEIVVALKSASPAASSAKPVSAAAPAGATPVTGNATTATK